MFTCVHDERSVTDEVKRPRSFLILIFHQYPWIIIIVGEIHVWVAGWAAAHNNNDNWLAFRLLLFVTQHCHFHFWTTCIRLRSVRTYDMYLQWLLTMVTRLLATKIDSNRTVCDFVIVFERLSCDVFQNRCGTNAGARHFSDFIFLQPRLFTSSVGVKRFFVF